MASLTESRAAFAARAAEVGLTNAEVTALTGRGIDTLARIAFAAVGPGQNPSDAQVQDLFGGAPTTAGTVASTRRLIFEAHTLLIADLKGRVEKGEDASVGSMSHAERESRMARQKARITGLMHSGVEEPSYESYNLVYAMLQRDALVYIHPEKFTTRRQELSSQKPNKQVVLDGSGALNIKEKQTSLTCATSGELELVQALRRRALAFDLVGVCTYDTMNRYHGALVQRMQDLPPPKYAKVSVHQVLRTDRAAFFHLAEQLRTIKRQADGSIPLDAVLPHVLSDPAVSFHLLPLALPEVEKPPKQWNVLDNRGTKRQHENADQGNPGQGRQNLKGGGNKGGGKGKNDKLRVPKLLIGKWYQTREGERLCWAFNLPGGCDKAKAGEKCERGWHLCAEPNCLKAHSLQEHRSSSNAGCPTIRVDLTSETGQRHVLSILQEAMVVYVHVSPPHKMFFADRSASPAVEQLALFISRICKLCDSSGILFSVMNPVRSPFWKLPTWVKAEASASLRRVEFDLCMHGGCRKQSFVLMSNVVPFDFLESRCDNKHTHEPWHSHAQPDNVNETWPLGRNMADLLHDFMCHFGAVPEPCKLSDAAPSVVGARSLTGHQLKKRVPPLVPEFRQVISVQGPYDALAKLPVSKSKLQAPWPVPSSCSAKPEVSSVPLGSKVIRTHFARGGAECDSVVEVSAESLLECLSNIKGTLPSRGEACASSSCVKGGAFVHGGVTGVLQATKLHPQVIEQMCAFVRKIAPSLEFGAVTYSRDIFTAVHRDSHNEASSWNMVVLLKPCDGEGGGIWVEDASGDVCKNINGRDVRGRILDPSAGPVFFDPRKWHETQRWTGHRHALLAYLPRNLEWLSAADRDFVQQALQSKHPCHLDNLLPDELKASIKANMSKSEAEIARERTATMRRFISMSNGLVDAERELHEGFSEHRRKVLDGKRLLLFKSILEEAGHADDNLVHDMSNGFDLVGKLPESHVFDHRYRPALKTEEELRAGASRSRAAVLAMVQSSGDPVIDDGVFAATQKELDLGFLEGPVDPEQLPMGATLTHRFGVIQGLDSDGNPKVRPIDNYKSSEVNSVVSQTEQVPVHTVDVIAGTLSYWLQACVKAKVKKEMVSKAWDLKTAYKQLPLSDSAFELDSYIAVFCPRSKKPKVYKQRVLPFGSKASVTGFIRCAYGLWKIGCVLLSLIWSCYFDDFLTSSWESASKHLDMIVTMFFRLFGWNVSLDKQLGFDSMCNVLGVTLDLREAKFGVAYFSNTEKRAAELRAVLTEYVTGATSLPKGADLAKLRGRLQFAFGQLFGRRARHALGALTDEPLAGREQMLQSMRVLLNLFEHGRPRRVAATWSSVVHVYVDASFDYDGYSGIGGMAYDSSGHILGWFGIEVPTNVLDAICTYGDTTHETVIFELEALAVLLALRSFASFLKGANIVVFTDNEGVHGAFVRCKSASVYGHQVITCACDSEESLDCLIWYERVPSSSNPSDCLSRGEELKYTSSRVQVSITDAHEEVCAACL
ncbi:unnamed protein product [Symbiodinium sp. CCMP2456]|nr:unnamed protein product [Symbiodinium sp. CCMP2456]